MRYFIDNIKNLFLNFGLVCNLLWGKVTRPFKKFWMNVLLSSKKQEAKWRHKTRGGTWYVVMINWKDIQCLDKQRYDYIKKYMKKRYGKDIRRNLMYRADGTLVRNPFSSENLMKEA